MILYEAKSMRVGNAVSDQPWRRGVHCEGFSLAVVDRADDPVAHRYLLMGNPPWMESDRTDPIIT